MKEKEGGRGVTVADELVNAIRRRLPEPDYLAVESVPARPSRVSDWPSWVPPYLVNYYADQGVTRPWLHQARFAELAHRGTNVVVATGTSSGKSLAYQLPILTELAHDETACAIYITPTKALGSDQLTTLRRISDAVPELSGIHPAPYDGDTPPESRRSIRDTTRFALVTPDMLNASILPNHPRWARLLRRLRYVMIDECHVYRGVFGSGMSAVIRRLRRLCARYGSHPVFLLASATAADPARHAADLVGADVTAITEDGAPAGRCTVVLWEPCGNTASTRRPASTEAAEIMSALIAEGARTLTFARSRRGAEVVALRAREELGLMGRGDLAGRVAPYRAGYLAEDRRRLERDLDSGRLLGVATTSALELGIDVGALDAVVMAGYPGTIASFRQQAGRAGRRGQESLVVLVGRDDPMDTYLIHHPDRLLRHPLERTAFDPHNPHVLAGQVLSAVAEAPLTDAEVDAWGVRGIVDSLTAAGELRHRRRGWFLSPSTDAPPVPLRDGADEVLIVDGTDGRVLGTVDTGRAPAQVHPGAVYFHQADSYVVDSLDLDGAVAVVRPEDPDYSTSATSTTSVRILGELDRMRPSPGLDIARLDVEVTTRVTGFITRGLDGRILAEAPLDMPTQVLSTRAVAYTVDPAVLAAMGIEADEIPGALHAAEHAAIGLLPLLATCDRWDLGGLSTSAHPQTGLPTVFVYDGHPGGAGFADRGYQAFTQWIGATGDAVRSCPCEAGCPSCVQSPKCGNGNHPLDKHGAIRLLSGIEAMLIGQALAAFRPGTTRP